MHINAGQLGKYELRERLGQGGMAEVWKAFDARLQRYVAIKFLHSMLRSDPTFTSRFMREAQAVASLHHPNIVQVYDFETPNPGDEDSLAYMVMDYIEGQTLADYLRTTSHVRQFLDEPDLVSLFFSISEAIDYAHRHGLLHRDIKPANILLDQRLTARNSMGEPILTDFGIVKMLGSADGTLTSFSMGTPLYISPEQAQGHSNSAASDIYSLGVVLYEVCTGKAPFHGESPFAILQQHISAPPPPPEQINPAISPAQSAVILRCLAKNPEDRFPSAMALTSALAEALNIALPERRGQPISSPDIRSLPASSPDIRVLPVTPKQVEDLPTQQLEKATSAPADVADESAFDFLPTLVETPARQVPGAAQDKATRPPETTLSADQPRPPVFAPSERPQRTGSKRRGWMIGLVALLVIVLAGSSVAAFQIFHRAGSSTTTGTTTIVGNAFFASTGAASGANNLGINDEFQVNLTRIPAPAAGKLYYAWLLPDLDQPESSSRALGALTFSGGMATLPSLYIDPHHANLVGQFSRFLVTEEPANPAPTSPSLDTANWLYYASIPQDSPVQNCQGVITQLSVLCHMRHLLSGDPDLAKVNLPGGLNFWFLNNVKEMLKWAQEAMDHNNPVDIRHKVVNILYILAGRNCIQQSLQQASPGLDNTVDDHSLPTVAAIPLLDCSLTPDAPGYVAHIHNHLNAMLQSPGILSDQKSLANQIGPELNGVNAWLQQVQNDALKLVAMDNTQLLQTNAQNLRSEMDTLATNVLSGGINASTGSLEKGVQSIHDQIQQLARMNVTLYTTR